MNTGVQASEIKLLTERVSTLTIRGAAADNKISTLESERTALLDKHTTLKREVWCHDELLEAGDTDRSLNWSPNVCQAYIASSKQKLSEEESNRMRLENNQLQAQVKMLMAELSTASDA